MSDPRVPLYVRLPVAQVAAIDEIVRSTGVRKQQVVSEMISDQLSVGRLEITESPQLDSREVLTIDEAAELLRVTPAALEDRIADGAIPARCFGADWRISRRALMDWLAHGDIASQDTGLAAGALP
jgi:excisionase family DNA binding protein